MIYLHLFLTSLLSLLILIYTSGDIFAIKDDRNKPKRLSKFGYMLAASTFLLLLISFRITYDQKQEDTEKNNSQYRVLYDREEKINPNEEWTSKEVYLSGAKITIYGVYGQRLHFIFGNDYVPDSIEDRQDDKIEIVPYNKKSDTCWPVTIKNLSENRLFRGAVRIEHTTSCEEESITKSISLGMLVWPLAVVLIAIVAFFWVRRAWHWFS